jgi:hypothetical protein
MMTLNDAIQDIHGLNAKLTRLEQRYNLLSDDFYRLYRAGDLEQNRDFIKWVGFYEARLEREARYRELMFRRLRDLRQSAGLEALRLIPEVAVAGAS